MAARLCTIDLPVAMLQRGFWLYVWRVTTPKGKEMLYVGRTGDSSSHKAAPPYSRMGQHLGHVEASNALRRYLENERSIKPEKCRSYELIAYGPIFKETADMDEHKKPRDIVAGLEKKLADTLSEAGYDVLNTVNSRMPLDKRRWQAVRNSFLEHFPNIGNITV